MREFVSQRIDSIFTSSKLDPTELALVTSVANWSRPSNWAQYLYYPHGRSLVYRSPTRIRAINEEGVFSGLQLIGVGGTLSATKSGISYDKSFKIQRVSDTDCSDRLADIFELREIDSDGKLHYTHREYAPLCGMDKAEAVNRKYYTSYLSREVRRSLLEGSPLPFVVPEFAAEGFYVAKKDPKGESLHFQVYRVPLLDRFPSQLSREVIDNGVEAGLAKLGLTSALLGLSLRYFHEAGYAYMNGHIGNISLIESSQKDPVLYMTDLGSIKQFDQHPFPGRYRGFDFLMHLDACSQLYTDFSTLANTYNAGEIDPFNYLATALGGYLEGYFRQELFRKPRPEGYQMELNDITNKVLNAYLDPHYSPQQFIEYFEDFYQSYAANTSS